MPRKTLTGPATPVAVGYQDDDGNWQPVPVTNDVPVVTITTAQGAGATIGAASDAAVVTDAAGTLSAKLRGIVKLLAEIITVRIDHTTPGVTDYFENRPNARRAGAVLHRNGITVVDKLTDFVDASVTIADNGAGTGSLNASTTYYVTAIPGNRWGPCKVNANIDSLATAAYGANTGSIRATIAQATGPNSSIAEWYDLFLSTDAAPKWVARITEAQRAAGDFEVMAVGTVAAGGGNPAGTVDINVAGTGIQTSNQVFANNNAYVPNVASGITSINCAGYTRAFIHVRLVVTDLRSAPSVNIVPFLLQSTESDWYQCNVEVLNPLQQVGQSLRQVFVLDVNGASGLRVLIGTLVGQGAAASAYVELS